MAPWIWYPADCAWRILRAVGAPLPPALFMVRRTGPALELSTLPDGVSITGYREGRERDWCRIINSSMEFGWMPSTFRRRILGAEWYEPGNVLFAERADSGGALGALDAAGVAGSSGAGLSGGGRIVGTASAARTEIDGVRYGLIHMVGVEPGSRKEGIGRMLAIAATRRLIELGHDRIGLFTIPRFRAAIRIYRAIGFKPMMLHPSHERIWKRLS